jgi:hypothetical protein
MTNKNKTELNFCSKEVEIKLLKNELLNSNQKLNEIHKWLVGNGKKGLLDEVSEIRGALIFAKVGISILLSGMSLILLIVL